MARAFSVPAATNVAAAPPHLDRAAFDQLAANGRTVAVHRTVLMDNLTPLGVFSAIRKEGEPSFFFESARGGPRIARYSFVGTSPSKTITDIGGKLTLHGEGRLPAGDLFQVLRAECKAANAVRPRGVPRFAGGWVGFCGWDLARGAVGLPRRRAEHEALPADGLPDAVFHRFDDVIAFDHLENKVLLIVNVEIGNDPSAAWRTAQARLDGMEGQLRRTVDMPPPPKPVERDWEPVALASALPFEEQVALAKKHLVAGDIFQVVLSRTLAMQTDATPLAIYRALAAINPSPYLLYFETSGATIVGSSPEPLLRVQDGRVHIRPLAGTRARGTTREADRTKEFDLLESEKERAEHLMLVDLSRNDVGQVAKLGSVSVDEFLVIERYAHVMHLVSHVSGELDSSFDRFDALKAGFPAGTMSGAPKRRAVEIIGEVEGNARGLYAGGLGYIDLAGDHDRAGGLDMCIAIRCLVHRNREILVRTGAGIVFDSDPEAERIETETKARSLLAAVRLAERGLRL